MNKLRILIARNFLFSWVYKKMMLFFNLSVPKSMERIDLEIFDFKEIAEKCKNDKTSLIRDNNLYGIQEVFRNVIGYDFQAVMFEHGVVFGGLVPINIKHTFAKKIVTFGSYRSAILREKVSNKEILEVGPYIHYADDFINADDLNQIKKDLGRTVVLFPSHSTKSIDINFDIDQLCQEVESITKGKYDTKIVCLYWKDIELRKYEYYQKRGFLIVCSGYLNDTYFLQRLKSIIKLSDLVIGNSIGTFIGYAVYLEKPVVLLKQSHLIKSARRNSKDEIYQRSTSDIESFSAIENTLFQLFSNVTKEITEEQYNTCKYIWGYDKIKTGSELRKLLDNC